MREECTKNDIYNDDETDNFENISPQHTFNFNGEKCVGGKLSKNRLTALVNSSVSGTDKRKLFVIRKYKNSRYFKHVKNFPL